MISKFAVSTSAVGAALAQSNPKNLRSSLVQGGDDVGPAALQPEPAAQPVVSAAKYKQFLISEATIPTVAQNREFGVEWASLADFEAKGAYVADAAFWGFNTIPMGANAAYSAAALESAQRQYPEEFTLEKYVELMKKQFPDDASDDAVVEYVTSVATDLYSEQVEQVHQDLLQDLIQDPTKADAIKNDQEVYQYEAIPGQFGVLTHQHSERMAHYLNQYTASEVERLSADETAKPYNMPFHLGGQPFYGVDKDGEYTDIKGYELLLRYAGTDEAKLHVTASKTIFQGSGPFPPKNHHLNIDQVQNLQQKQIEADNKTNACNFILFQAYWARNLLIQAQGKITFITFNIRADEYVLNCGDFTLESKLLEISREVRSRTHGKSYIVYEATEYAKWTPAARAVLKNLVDNNVEIWIDDVLIKSDIQGNGIAKPNHHTSHDVALELIEGGMATAHKFGSPLSTQLTGRGLDRFDRKLLADGADLPPQAGPTQHVATPQQRDVDAELSRKATEYMQKVNQVNSSMILVIECSAEGEQLKTKLMGALNDTVNLENVYVQGGASADFGVQFEDLLALHK